MLKIKDLDEKFVDIKGYEGRYKVGDKGTILGLSRSNDERYRDNVWLLKQYEDSNGYMYVTLNKNKKRQTIKVHKLVAENFILNQNNYPIVNHIDGDKTNNHISNLEWCTQQYNVKHAYNNGLKKGVSAEHRGSKNPKSKLTEKEVLLILDNKKKGIDIRDSYSLFKNQISFKGFENIWYGYTWKHLVEKVEN